jgi:hypothetical protein
MKSLLQFLALALLVLLAKAQGATVSVLPSAPEVVALDDKTYAVWGYYSQGPQADLQNNAAEYFSTYLETIGSETLTVLGPDFPRFRYSIFGDEFAGAVMGQAGFGNGVSLFLSPPYSQPETTYDIWAGSDGGTVEVRLDRFGERVATTALPAGFYGRVRVVAQNEPLTLSLVQVSESARFQLGAATVEVVPVPEPGLGIGLLVLAAFTVAWYWFVIWVDRRIQP